MKKNVTTPRKRISVYKLTVLLGVVLMHSCMKIVHQQFGIKYYLFVINIFISSALKFKKKDILIGGTSICDIDDLFPQ